jgi:DNA polymerase-3 subunit delta'
VDFLSVNSLPWLAGAQEKMRDAGAAGRLPQSLLLLSQPGLGAEALASWICALALCESPAAPPCGVCGSCVLLRADNHPDFHRVQLLDDAQQIKVDQIRDLIETLSLSSYRGGRKTAVVESAECLNANGANAFLKTLEEPSGDTLLILIARPGHRLPATVASRCVRLRLRPPGRQEAVAWLAERDSDASGWDAALDLAAGAPLLALELPAQDIERLEKDMREGLTRLEAGRIDVTLLAETWVKSDLSLRLIWLENWVTRRVQAEMGGAISLQSAEPVVLPAALLKPKIRALFELLDAARELRRLASTGLNQQLALEALLLGGRAALSFRKTEIEKSK